jgi:uracil-DNA glycosylase family 4
VSKDNPQYVGGSGPLGAKLAIVGESPSWDELDTGKPFTGPSGKELDRLCKEAGFYRSNCWVTNVVKEFVIPNPPDKKIPFRKRCMMSGVDVDKYIDELRVELNQIKPNCILGLGATALWAATGKTKLQQYRGSIMYGLGSKFVGTWHPVNFIRAESEMQGYWNRKVSILDMKRAWEEAQSSELNLPTRHLYVARNSHQVLDFFNRYKGHARPAVDIEAIDCIPACIGFAFNQYEGMTVPLWNIPGKIEYIHNGEMPIVWQILAEQLWRDDIVGQNFGYDRDKIKRLGFIIKRLASDTMLKSFCINPELPKNLAFNTSIYTREPFYKDEGMYEGSIEDLFIGCARDSCVTKEIDLLMDGEIDEMNLRPFYENFIMQLSPLYSWIENNGLRTDMKVKEQLIEKYVTWAERLNYHLFKIAGVPINVNSPKQVNIFLYESLKIPHRIGTGEEVLTQILNNVKLSEIQRSAIELVLEKRRVDKTINNYLLSPTDFDGRTRTSYFLCLETGRSSTNQQEPPIRPAEQVISYHNGKLKSVVMGSAFQTMTKHGDIGADIRTQYIADEGEVFIQVDSSQAEARVVAKLANDEATLRMYDECDAHALTASWFFGGSESDYSKKVLGYECNERFAGKTLRHSGNLGASKRRASIELNTQARKYKMLDKKTGLTFTISEKEADIALIIFHKKTPNIKNVFQKEVVDCLSKRRQLTAPVPYGIDAPKGGTRTFFERWGDELFREAFAYLPQRTVSENTKAAALRIRKRAPWIRILIESHDSLLCSVSIPRVNDAAIILRQEMERPIDFSKCSLPRGTLVIPADIETGYNYKELSKYRYLVPDITGIEIPA